jgi:hypothetical protein
MPWVRSVMYMVSIFVYIQSLRLILQNDVYLLFVRLLFDYTKFMQLTVNMHQQWTKDSIHMQILD